MEVDIPTKGIPTRRELWDPTIRALDSQGGTASYKQIRKLVILELGLARSLPEQFWNNLHWARRDLQKNGLVKFLGDGIWALTEEGLATANKIPSSDGIRPDPGTRRKSHANSFWRSRLLKALLDMSPSAFERLCQRILRESGFEKVRLTGGPGDDGIDGQGIIRLAGLISIPVLFQCKRYKGNVSSTEVRGFRGALQGKADYGLIITTGVFTKNARQEATKEGASSIDLIDGEILIDKLQELKLGVNTREDGTVELDTKWFNSI